MFCPGSSAAKLCSAVSLLVALLPITLLAVPARYTVNVSAGADAAAIQLALDSLPAAGGDVVLAAGRFLLRQPLVLQRDHLGLRGQGTNTVLTLADNANCPVVVLGTIANVPRRIVRDLRLADLFIDGNRRHQQFELWQTAGDGSLICNNGVSIRAVAEASVEAVTCAHCRSGGLVTERGIRQLQVHNFTAVDNEFDGLACYLTEQSVFTDLCLHDNAAAGISLDWAFQHNVISNAVLTGNDVGVFMRDSRDNVFSSLDIRANRSHGVFVAQWPARPTTACTGNRFLGLVVRRCGGAAVRINDLTCINNIFPGAQFFGTGHDGVWQAKP